MEEKETKVVTPTEEKVEEKVVEIEDVDLGLTEEDVVNVAKKVDEKVKEQHVLNKEQQELMNQIFAAAKMPVKMENKDFKLGENELDIRGLSSSNKTQMIFRTLVTLNISVRECMTTLIDITRLLMIMLDKQGVPDIIQATDDIIEKVEGQHKIKEKLKADKGEDKEPVKA